MRLSASAEPPDPPLRFRAEEKCVLFLMPSNIHMPNRSQRKRLAGLSPDLSSPLGQRQNLNLEPPAGTAQPSAALQAWLWSYLQDGKHDLSSGREKAAASRSRYTLTSSRVPGMGWTCHPAQGAAQHPLGLATPPSPALFLFPASTNELSSINACLSPGWVPNGSAQERWPEANWCSFESSAVISEMGEKWLRPAARGSHPGAGIKLTSISW